MQTQLRTQSSAGKRGAGEDPELTAFLSAQVAALLSGSHEPRPCCPRCGGDHITSAGFKKRQSGRLPMFECQTCGRYFGRTVDTPLSENHLKKLCFFISLLSHLKRENEWAAAQRHAVREHEDEHIRAHDGIHPLSGATTVAHAGVGNRGCRTVPSRRCGAGLVHYAHGVMEPRI